MNPARPFRALPRCARLRLREELNRASFWTESLVGSGAVAGERVASRPEGDYRFLDPSRSKLGAALQKGFRTPLPEPGEQWLYLGAASGTTASHVADLVGPSGRLFAIEKSVRPFARLLATAERYPNLMPILADARVPSVYLGLVPPVEGLYADIAQPDQVEIVLENISEFLRPGGKLLFALKTASMGRDAAPSEHLEAAETALRPRLTLVSSVALDPFHRRHYLIAGRLPGAGRNAEGSRSFPAHRSVEERAPPTRAAARPPFRRRRVRRAE